MLTLIHGDNQAESRSKLQEIKREAQAKGKEVIILEGEKLEPGALVQALEAQSLFAEDKLVVVEELLSSRNKNEATREYLKSREIAPDVVLWEPKKIDGRKIRWIKNKPGKVLEYSYPQLLFKFLEAIGSPLKVKTLGMFNELVRRQPVELIYYMIVRQFRLLILIKSDATGAKIKETKRLQAWQIKRLKQQSSSISMDKLLKSYKKLTYIDYQQKTGQSALDLKQTLDIFLTQF